MKAISAVIVIILILMMVISLSSILYLFVTGVFTVTTETGKESIETVATSMVSRMTIESIDINKIYLRNTGNTNLTGFAIYVDGKSANIDAPSSIAKEEVGSITIYDFIKENDEIKITTDQGAVTSQKAPDPCDKAVLCLDMDEGSGNTAYDSAGHTGNDGVFNGESFNDGSISGATRVDGKYGKALEFDGIDDYVGIPDPGISSLDITNEITIEAWIKPNAINGYRTILVKRATSTNYGFRINGGKLEFYYSDSVPNWQVWQTTNTTFSTGNWYYVVVTFTFGIGTSIRVYVDGSVVSGSWISGDGNINVIPNDISIRIGYFSNQNFNGTIDEVRIYNRSLTQAEIQAEMQSSTPTIRPVASYSFEESGQYATDTHVWVKGKHGPALSFDGIDDYINVTHNENFNFPGDAKPFTLEAWFKTSQTTPRQEIIMKGPTNGYYRLAIGGDYDNDRLFGRAQGSGFNWMRIFGPFLGDGDWHHAVFVYNPSKDPYVFLYCDGEDIGFNIGSAGPLPNNIIPSNDLYIGSWEGSNYFFNGTIDEVRIYNKAIY